MTDRLIRLMRIITLVQAKPGILARELAERCGTSERTIYRDMDALSAMHIPIAHQGHGKGYAFIGNFALHPLDWSEEEASAFSRITDIMKEIKPVMPQGFESAVEKVLAAGYKQRADREERMEIYGREGGRADRTGRHSAYPPFLTDILSASLKRRTLLADYFDHTYEELGLEIDPYLLIPADDRFHLVGYCHRSGMLRSFDIGYFVRVKQLEREFTKAYADLEQFLKTRERAGLRKMLRTRFKVRFTETGWRQAKQETFPFQPVGADSGARTFHYEVDHDQGSPFIRWIARYEDEAEILEPFYY